MIAVGTLLLCLGAVICFPLAMLYLGVIVGRRSGVNNADRVKIAGPSVGDLKQAASEKLLRGVARPAAVVAVVCVSAGGLLVLVGRG